MADIKNITELAYFAGFFDGEGCVAIYKKKYVVSLTNTDVRPLKKVQEMWGGFINVQKKENRRFAIQDIFRWQVYGHNARPFLEAIRPFVLVKREQIDIYLSVLDVLPKKANGKRGHSGNLWNLINVGALKLRELKINIVYG